MSRLHGTDPQIDVETSSHKFIELADTFLSAKDTKTKRQVTGMMTEIALGWGESIESWNFLDCYVREACLAKRRSRSVSCEHKQGTFAVHVSHACAHWNLFFSYLCGRRSLCMVIRMSTTSRFFRQQCSLTGSTNRRSPSQICLSRIIAACIANMCLIVPFSGM